MYIRMLILASLLSAGATAAFADEGTAAERAACRPDVRKFCPHVGAKSGAEAYKTCLQDNFSKLSPKCQQALMAHK